MKSGEKKEYLRVVAKDKFGNYQTLTVNSNDEKAAKLLACRQYGIKMCDILYVERVKIGDRIQTQGMII